MRGEGFPPWEWLPGVAKECFPRCSPWLPKGITPMPGTGIFWGLSKSTVLSEKSFIEIDIGPRNDGFGLF